MKTGIWEMASTALTGRVAMDGGWRRLAAAVWGRHAKRHLAKAGRVQTTNTASSSNGGTLQIIGVTLCAVCPPLRRLAVSGSRARGPGNREAAADGPGNGNGQGETARGRGEGRRARCEYMLSAACPPTLATQSIIVCVTAGCQISKKAMAVFAKWNYAAANAGGNVMNLWIGQVRFGLVWFGSDWIYTVPRL